MSGEARRVFGGSTLLYSMCLNLLPFFLISPSLLPKRAAEIKKLVLFHQGDPPPNPPHPRLLGNEALGRRKQTIWVQIFHQYLLLFSSMLEKWNLCFGVLYIYGMRTH